MSHQANIFILLFGALQGILLSLWMIRYEKKRISNRYLSAFLIVVGLQLTFKVISKTWVMDHALIPYVISYKLPYLIGPLLYLFVRSRKEESWKPLDLLHFIPFAFFTAVEFFWNGLFFPPLRASHLPNNFVGDLFISCACDLATQLVKQFIAFVASAEFIIIVTLAVMFVYYGRFPDVRLLFMVLTILIYWISYKVLSRSSLFFQASPAVMALPSKKKCKICPLESESRGGYTNHE